MDIVLIAFLTLLNAAFAMTEMALATARRARLTALAEADDSGAQAALRLMQDPTSLLSTVQVGITSIGMLNGIVGESAFSAPVGQWLQGLGMAEKASAIAATALVVTVITFITIIFGELVPKRIGQLYPEIVARWVSRPMAGLATAAKPFVRLLSATTLSVLKLLRIDTDAQRTVTEEEIEASLAEGVGAGLIEAHEHQMVKNVFHLDDRPLSSIMVPRSDIRWFDSHLSAAQALKMAAGQHEMGGHSWYPVCRGGLDDVIGIVGVAQLLNLGPACQQTIEEYVQPAAFVPETLSGMELLEQLRARSGRVLFVVDEYGVVQGLLTPRDLLEAITGELQPGAMVDAWAVRQPDGSWLLDGMMPILEFKTRLNIKTPLPDEDKDRYNTLAGLLQTIAGRLLQAGDTVSWESWHFEVEILAGKRIEQVRAWVVDVESGLE